MDQGPIGPSVWGISQAKILEWVAISFSRGSFQPRDQTWVSWFVGRFFTTEPPGKPHGASRLNSPAQLFLNFLTANIFPMAWKLESVKQHSVRILPPTLFAQFPPRPPSNHFYLRLSFLNVSVPIQANKIIHSESEVVQLCPTLCDPMDGSLPGSTVHGIFQARMLEWAATSFSRGSSQPRDQTQVSCIADRGFTVWATYPAPNGKIHTHTTHTHTYTHGFVNSLSVYLVENWTQPADSFIFRVAWLFHCAIMPSFI